MTLEHYLIFHAICGVLVVVRLCRKVSDTKEIVFLGDILAALVVLLCGPLSVLVIASAWCFEHMVDPVIWRRKKK